MFPKKNRHHFSQKINVASCLPITRRYLFMTRRTRTGLGSGSKGGERSGLKIEIEDPDWNQGLRSKKEIGTPGP